MPCQWLSKNHCSFLVASFYYFLFFFVLFLACAAWKTKWKVVDGCCWRCRCCRLPFAVCCCCCPCCSRGQLAGLCWRLQCQQKAFENGKSLLLPLAVVAVVVVVDFVHFSAGQQPVAFANIRANAISCCCCRCLLLLPLPLLFLLLPLHICIIFISFRFIICVSLAVSLLIGCQTAAQSSKNQK